MSGLTALGKVAAVLDALQTETRMARVAEVTGLPGSTTHRILHELKRERWVSCTDEGEWRLTDRAPRRRAGEAALVQVIGDALSEWCTRMGWPFARVQALRPYGAARAVLTALQTHASRGAR